MGDTIERLEQERRLRTFDVTYECPGDSAQAIERHTFIQSIQAAMVSELPKSMPCSLHDFSSVKIGHRLG